MAGLEISSIKDEQRPVGMWASALLHAIARAEAAGRLPPRLTEPRQDTWRRFRGRLSSTDFISLLFEDAAVLYRIPFDPVALGEQLSPDRLTDNVADAWMEAVASLPFDSSGADYVAEQARLLWLPTRMGRSDLHVVKPHQKVLELPGTGGQLAHHLISTQRDVTLQDNFVVACGSWQELTLAGIIALELGAPHTRFARQVDVESLRKPEHPIRQRSFDFVIGLHPDRGGLFRVENQLAIWFPTAKVLLV
ncbi:MAG: hypothetical protein HYV63_26105 [Candidatus Schekmanbacteria bacterium]|nr:hypothetical protein [Candidatus Schekmanbacteria bacterium]